MSDIIVTVAVFVLIYGCIFGSLAVEDMRKHPKQRR